MFSYVMSKIIKKDNSVKRSEIDTSLDTLEVTSDFFLTKSHEQSYYAALSKARTIQSNNRLIDVSSKDWKKKYWKTFHCKNTLLQNGSKSKGELCRKRWCENCNRIKTAEMMNGYSKPLQDLQEEDDLYFITLTSKTVQEKRLRHEIERRYKAFTRIKDNLRKNHNIRLVGCRKLEVTYNEKEDWYHPHFHFIQKGKREAEMLLEYWYKHNPLAGAGGQSIKLIDANDSKSLIELFKYATKEVAKDEINAKALHNIYKSIDCKRVFQTYGKLRKVKEIKEAKEEFNDLDFIKPNSEIWVYDLALKDYTNAYDQDLIGTVQIEYDIEEAEYKKHLLKKVKISKEKTQNKTHNNAEISERN